MRSTSNLDYSAANGSSAQSSDGIAGDMAGGLKQSSTQDSREPAAFSESQIEIILTAEQLFAQASIDGVSLREIAVRAHQRNNFAVQYHFGSRDALVQAVFGYRMQQMEPRRSRMLEDAKAGNALQDARVLLEIIYLPQLDVLDADGKHSYANFLCQYLLRGRFVKFGDFGTPLPPNLSRVLRLLRTRVSYLPPSVAQRRLMGCNFVFLNVLATYGVTGAGLQREFDSAVADALAQIEVAMCMPYEPRGRAEGKPKAS